MKNIVASVGLLAVGASSVSSAYAASFAALTAQGKPWSVSATLRGFYDDNVGTTPDTGEKTKAFGFEISPSLTYAWGNDLTSVKLDYVYSFRYYDKRPPGNVDKDDQTHSFNILLNHTFTERYAVAVQDSFVIGQEPDLLRAQHPFEEFHRVAGDNIRNYGSIRLDAQLTPVFGMEVGYANSFFDYDDSGGNAFSPSLSGLLDRIEHMIHIDGRWQVQPQTVGVVGYQYSQVDYTGNEEIGIDVSTLQTLTSKSRNNRSHYGYVGADHVFRPDLTGTIRIGARYYDYYNEPNQSTDVAPSVQASLQYAYTAGSYAELGVTHDRNATDLFSAVNGNLTVDAESTVVYGSVNHQIMPGLIGSVVGQFQNSSLNGGAFNNIDERFYLVGLNLEYRFNPHLAAHVGYNYDKLDSDANRSFDRNRVYVGVTATY